MIASRGRFVPSQVVALVVGFALTCGASHAQATLPGDVEGLGKIGQFQGGFFGPIDADERFGASVAALGDVDGDGIGDIAVGTPFADVGGPWRGGVWIMFLEDDASVREWTRISSEDGGLVGLEDFDQFGEDLAPLGDVDGDGVPDLAVGAPGDDGNTGAVYVLRLAPDGTVASQTTIGDGVSGIELDEFDAFGRSVATIGDLDGDGSDDLAIGAPLDDDGKENTGALWVVFLDADATPHEVAKISLTTGGLRAELDTIDLFASSVDGLGDVDGDGVPDLVVGTPNDSDDNLAHGCVYVLLMRADGSVRDTVKINHLTGGLDADLDGVDQFGTDVAGLGDLDGDGTPDVAVSAPADDDAAPGTFGSSRGAVYVLSLEASGRVGVTHKISDSTPSFEGELIGVVGFGLSVAPAGDLDGDGTVDLLVGVDRDPGFGGQPKGAVWSPRLHAAEQTDVGGGFAADGASEPPTLTLTGTLVPGTDVSLTVTTRAPGAPVAVVTGAELVSLPFGGGLLGPAPDVVTLLTADAEGRVALATRWPDAPNGTTVHAQAIVLGDALSATDAISVTSP